MFEIIQTIAKYVLKTTVWNSKIDWNGLYLRNSNIDWNGLYLTMLAILL